MKDGGEWKAMPSFLSIDKENRALTSCQLVMSLLSQVQGQVKSTLLRKWIFLGDADDWSLGHNNPTKTPPRNIAPWAELRLLSAAIEAGCYEPWGSTSKLYTIWLFYMSEPPPTSSPSRTTSPKPIKKGAKRGKVKAGDKMKREIKAEGKAKREPTSLQTFKQSLLVSAEISVRK